MNLNFDATQHDPSQVMSVCLPLEDYYFTVVKAEPEETKGKQGEGFLTVHLRIDQGPFKGTIQKDRFNLWNSNPQAVQIAYRELSALCHVTNRLRLGTEQDLVGGQGRATIGPQADNEKYSEVKQYKFLDGTLPGGQGQQQQPQQQPQQSFQQQPQQQPQQTPFGQPQQQPQQPVQGAGFGSQPQNPSFGQPASGAPFGAGNGNGQPANNPGNLPPWAK